MNIKGWYQYNGKKDEMIWESFCISGSKISGGGSDSVGKFTFSGSVDGKGLLKFDKVYMDARTIKYQGGIYKDAATGTFYMGGQWKGPRRSGTSASRCAARRAEACALGGCWWRKRGCGRHDC